MKIPLVVPIPPIPVNYLSEPDLPEWATDWHYPLYRKTIIKEVDPVDLLQEFNWESTEEKTFFNELRKGSSYELYRKIIFKKLIANCLNLQIGMAIAEYPYRLFGEISIPLWQSVVKGTAKNSKDGEVTDEISESAPNLFVPHVQIISGQKPIIRWYGLEYPARRFSVIGLLSDKYTHPRP